MALSETNKNEIIKVREIIDKLNKIDEHYIRSESEVISQIQPFLLSMILGYRLDLKAEVLEEITKLIFLIWEYFKDNEKVRQNKITESQFEKIQNRNTHLLKYFEGEPDFDERMKVISSDLDHLDSLILLSGIYLKFNTKNALIEMNEEKRGKLIIGLKSLIECFEEIEKSSSSGFIE